MASLCTGNSSEIPFLQFFRKSYRQIRMIEMMDISQEIIKDTEYFEDIDEICSKILKEFEETEGNDRSVITLRQVCGKTCCYKNVIDSSTTIQVLLDSLKGNILNNFDSENTLEIAKLYKNILQSNIIYYPEVRSMLEKCIILILTKEKKTLDESSFLMNAWNSSCFDGSFPLTLVETFIIKLPNCVEDDVLTAVGDILKNNIVDGRAWTLSRDVRLIKWCSLSKPIFYIVTSILNQLIFHIMTRTKQFNLCTAIVNSFVLKVKESCDAEAQDYMSLYPRQLQSISLVLELDPIYLSQCGHELFSTTIKQLNECLRIEPIRTFLLLTHFPKWTSMLNKCNIVK